MKSCSAQLRMSVKSGRPVLQYLSEVKPKVGHNGSFELENLGSRIDMQTHAGSSSTRPWQHGSLATVRP